MRINPIHNNNCDGAHCLNSHGQVRVLPLNKNDSSNLILCRSCFMHEIAWRREENKRVANPYDLPCWEDLEVYALD